MIELAVWATIAFCAGLLFGVNYGHHTYGPWMEKQKRLAEERDKEEYERLKRKYGNSI